MASVRAKIASAFLAKFMNMNPESGKGFAAMTGMISNNGTKLKKGYVRTVEQTERGTRYERIRPIAGGNDKVIYYLHGGGYVVGLSQMYRTLACDLSKAAGGATCILLDYDLAPEYLYPAQHEQAWDVWMELTQKQGVLPKNMLIGGDSAGGNLTSSFLLHLRDAGYELPKAVVLISPWTDMSAEGESYVKNYNVDPLFGEKGVRLDEPRRERMLASEMYAWCGDANRKDPLVSPVYGDYSNFPPTLMTVGGNELLLDDTLTIAKDMESKGVDVTVIQHEGMFHIYPLFPMFPEGKSAFKDILRFVTAQMAE